ncbi:MAG: 4-hydroxy-2-oxovalerate aldolase [Dehalococcoidales bacterium]|nr:4-hydroxy-2-oxovalerate aldolase [Dehalococcoidales bacterium]
MRKNIAKEKIKQGKTAYGVFVPMASPTIVEMIGHIGFDFVLLDAEHSPIGTESCEQMVRAADCVNITPIIRIAMSIRQNILRYLDIGALGAQMPMVNSGPEVQAVMDAVKYPPEGKRGLAGVRAANYGLKGSLGDYVKEANQETMVIVQVETMEAVKNLKEILAVPGPDVIFIGPTDLSSAMGYPGQANHPEVQKMIDYLVKEIHAAGKASGTIAYDLALLKKAKERGIRYIVYNVGAMLARSGREYLEAAAKD